MRNQPCLETKEVAMEGAAGVHLHVRLKQAAKQAAAAKSN
jgi:hypothetical protein